MEAVERALPEGWVFDVADRFEQAWQRELKQQVPPAWPASFRARLVGRVYREFLEDLRAEDARGPLLDRVLDEVAGVYADQTKPQVKRFAAAAAAESAEAWLSPLLEAALGRAAANMRAEIEAAASTNRRIRQLKPKDLHRFASQYNWDDGYLHLFEVIRSPSCALATAVMLYRLGRPHYFLQYKSRRDVPSYCIDNYDLLIEIEARIAAGSYPDHPVRSDARAPAQTASLGSPPLTGKKRAPLDAEIARRDAGGAAAPLHSSRYTIKSSKSTRRAKAPSASRRTATGTTRAAR
jgi:hypothetical protein